MRRRDGQFRCTCARGVGTEGERRPFVADVVRETEVTRIVLEGDIDVCTVGRVQAVIEEECAFRGSHTIVIDLSAVEFVDSHGLRLLANTHQSLTSEGRALVVVPPPDIVWRAFVFTGLDAVLVVQEDAQMRHNGRARVDKTDGRAQMAETYTNGVWIVKPGEEDAFVSAWREFASWGHTRPGCGTLRLVRDTSEREPLHELRRLGELRGATGVEGRPRVRRTDGAGAAARGGLHAVGLRARDRGGLRPELRDPAFGMSLARPTRRARAT